MKSLVWLMFFICFVVTAGLFCVIGMVRMIARVIA
ncbi:Uncharacterised protein [Escherichia coli]|nr:hypothetical protein BvCmsSIP038_03692 [Escherichia coli]SQM92933.1 Uncharacterised protein [Escherichia coli]SQP99078.1 Uncharacterised protein [Escherichia coli]